MSCLNVVQLAGTTALLGNTAALNQAVFTPSSAAPFRITLWLYANNPVGHTNTVTATLTWMTAGPGSPSNDVLVSQFGYFMNAQSSTLDVAAAGIPFTLTTTVTTSEPYDIYVLIEQFV